MSAQGGVVEEKSQTVEEIKRTVSDYILKNFLPGAGPEELTDATPLITSGVLDSLATLKLVYFLEDHYRIELQPQERVTHLDTITSITQLVQSKL